MNTEQLLNEILAVLKTVKDDKATLEKIHEFMFDEIYEEPVDEENNIPKKYQKAIRDIAQIIDTGLICFVNVDTLEFVELTPDIADEPEEYEAVTGENYDELPHHDWENCIRLEPLFSNQSYKIMERFTDTIDDLNLKRKAENTLNRRRPFANFKNLIEDSDYRQVWFDFKQKQLEKHVWEELEPEISRES